MQSKTRSSAAKFNTGAEYITPGAADALIRESSQLGAEGESAARLLNRHRRGDWGDLCSEDKQANEIALQTGGRLFSNYNLKTGGKLYVITEWDRSSTTILTPDEY